MIEMTLSQAAKLLSPAPLSPEGQAACLASSFAMSAHTFRGVSIDTRTLLPGNLFVALPGNQTDGHDFIEAAKQKGARAALVTRRVTCDLPQWVVPDVSLALGQLSAYWRNQFTLPVAAVTGSNGKTTLKNMLATIMLAACKEDANAVLATQGTLNNHLGLPLTLLRLNQQHRYAAIEMGMNHPGEIAYLTKMTQPHVAIITNAAQAHLEGVGSIEGVARAKAEIFLGLAQGGTAILNRDDAYFTFWREQIGHHAYLTFGLHPDADIRMTETLQNQIHIQTPQGHFTAALPLLGHHNKINALAATATAIAMGIDLPTIQAGLKNSQAAPGRLALRTLANGINMIDDTYNANPFSLEAAIHTLAHFDHKKILVLGDMKELGDNAEMLHQEAGNAIRQAGIHYLFTYGELSAHAAEAFGQNAQHFNLHEREQLLATVQPLLDNNVTILVKGSRSMRMEKIVEHIENNLGRLEAI